MPVREDDPSIADDEMLWRRILNIPDWIKKSDDGTFRTTSAAFLDGRTNEVSVHRAILTTQEKALEGKPDEGLVEIRAEFPRSLGQIVVYDPIQNHPTLRDDISHSLICPPQSSTKSTRKSDARLMAQEASKHWLVLPKRARQEDDL
jgi:hypothetical protein